MQDALGSAPAGGDWRHVLSEAFVRRLFALEAANLQPAVMVDEPEQRSLPAPSNLQLPTRALTGALSEPDSPPRKRKWNGAPLGSVKFLD